VGLGQSKISMVFFDTIEEQLQEFDGVVTMTNQNRYTLLTLIALLFFIANALASKKDDVDRMPTGEELGEAMDIPMEFQVQTLITSGSENNFAVQSSFGVIEPPLGDSFAVMSTGVVGAAEPQNANDAFDKQTLFVSLFAPEGVNRLSFQYNFFTSEFPNVFFPGYDISDTFTVVMTDGSGRREIARETIVSVDLAVANASNAGGTGFEIPSSFTDSPSGSTTGFKTIEVDVVDNTGVVLEFSIEDRNDIFANSTVLIDSITLSSFEIRDPNTTGSDNLIENGTITPDRERLVDGGAMVERAAADGVTQILVRSKVSGPGTVEYCLDDDYSAPEDGGFGPVAVVGTPIRATCAEIDVEEVDEQFYAFATYTVPDDFNNVSNAHGSEKERDVRFKSTYTAESGTTLETFQDFIIARPPLFLIHGIWSSKETWSFPLVNDARFDIVLVDYSATHAEAFAVNQGVLGKYLDLYGPQLRESKSLAFTQIDVAGHSMGGILTRLYSQLPNYERNENFFEGDVNRLITLDTPHLGSPFGNKIKNVRDSNPLTGAYLELLMSGMSPSENDIPLGGASDDLGIDSPAINSMQQTDIPSHALVGNTGQAFIEEIGDNLNDSIDVAQTTNNPPWIAVAFLDAIRKLVPVAEGTLQSVYEGAFGMEASDAIVSVSSQIGGIAGGANSVPSVATIFEGTHTGVTGSAAFSTRIIELLNTQISDAQFAEFPATSTQPMTPPASDNVSVNSVTPGLEFATVQRMMVSSGDVVSVTVNTLAGSMVDEVSLTSNLSTQVDKTAPFVFNVSIPDDAFGTYSIIATGRNAQGDFYTSTNQIDFDVSTSASLLSIAAHPSAARFVTIGEDDKLAISGTFSDGFERQLTLSDTGTIYTSDNPLIASVSEDGLVTATGVGRTFIGIENNGQESSVSVYVGPPNEKPVAIAGVDQLLLTGASFNLDATASFDSDTGPSALAYEWNQFDGPNVGFFSPSSQTLSFTANNEGDYGFSLKVNDGQDNSQLDSVIVRVVDTNDVPSAVADSYQAIVNTELQVGLPGVLDNDMDTHPLFALLVSPATNGAVGLNANGSFTYTPNLDFIGADSFSYLATDTLDDSAATIVMIEVINSIDTDSDGISDDVDNCTFIANSSQLDSNNDGFGNACDPDLNNDLIVNFLDIQLFAQAFGTSNADADFNGDGFVNFLDFVLYSTFFLQPPGPSAIAD